MLTNPKPKRLLLFLLWIMMTVAYLDRVNISVAGPTIMAALHLNKEQFGWALSAFQCGYALMQIPGGYLADRIGSRSLLLAALVIWSVFTGLTGTVSSLAALIVIRIFFGFGEGIENGAQFKLIGAHFDARERSNANALFLTALAVGPALGSPLVTYLVGQVGWRALFYWCAVVGIAVAVLLAVLLPRDAGKSAAPEAHTPDRSDWNTVLSRPTSWLSFGAYLCFNIGFWGFVYWMPSYLSAARHIQLKELGFTAAIPFIGGFFGLLALGYLGTNVLPRHRALLVGTGYLFAGGCLYGAFSVGELAPCIAALSGAAFFLYGGFGPFWAIAQGLVPDSMRGAFTGFVNLGGQIGGIIAPVVVGKIVDASGSFMGGFLFMIVALVLSACILALLQRHSAGAEFLGGVRN